jgi:hypothetical protein
MSAIKKFWNFLREDSIYSLFAVLLIAVILIKFIFFPLLSFLTGSPLPLVIVESCSMYHSERGFEKIFEQKEIYEKNDIRLEDASKWEFQDGLNKGDVIFVVGAKNVNVGDIIIFNANSEYPYPIIHRVISKSHDSDGIYYSTFGDNNLAQIPGESKIYQDQVIGKALFRVPRIGWIKLIFFEPFRQPEYRGFC